MRVDPEFYDAMMNAIEANQRTDFDGLVEAMGLEETEKGKLVHHIHVGVESHSVRVEKIDSDFGDSGSVDGPITTLAYVPEPDQEVLYEVLGFIDEYPKPMVTADQIVNQVSCDPDVLADTLLYINHEKLATGQVGRITSGEEFFWGGYFLGLTRKGVSLLEESLVGA